MDNFQQYDNTAGFFVGNEVLNVREYARFLSLVPNADDSIVGDAPAAPYLLTALADLKGYQKAKGYRTIPIGYSATDTTVLRPMLQNYLVCKRNESERVDFYALNSYEWCGTQSSYTISGYNILQQYANGYPVPIFLSEDGCNTVPPRTFDDQSAIFGPQMSGTWSGAIIYEWLQEMNGYGLVNYGPFAGKGVTDGTRVVDG
jgi:1,3-beta-glucanosyltransferase GAS1